MIMRKISKKSLQQKATCTNSLRVKTENKANANKVIKAIAKKIELEENEKLKLKKMEILNNMKFTLDNIETSEKLKEFLKELRSAVKKF